MEPADLTFGRHPQYGIVARNTRDLPAGQWILDRLDFRPVPGHPHLYALANHYRDGRAHTAQAIAMLRKAGFAVDADVEFEPIELAAHGQQFVHHEPVTPDVAFAEHPRLGVIAAIDDRARVGGELLEQHGWQHNAELDIYTLPNNTGHPQALDRVAAATLAAQRADLLVAVHPELAQAVTHHRAGQSAILRASTQHAPIQRFPDGDAAVARSPAVAALPGTPTTPAPAADSPAHPIDPSSHISRSR
ncbi:hypothetical protein [Streptantibioticus ferralitis]|uniref:Uncharacterized protein n=1 Tax=Streptantibioticus ferralitis TaxID=236510 RepID=A0ABT5YRX2_9ACTN|nr:hypothetical protein [Streptantibioticus ferralitis]MDF2254335.1 hypothetical protein [Streptantibioticus ferralitis]